MVNRKIRHFSRFRLFPNSSSQRIQLPWALGNAPSFTSYSRTGLSIDVNSLLEEDVTLQLDQSEAVTESKVLEFRLEPSTRLINHAQFFGANSVGGNFNNPTFGQVNQSLWHRV
jgi:hypothetical protein